MRLALEAASEAGELGEVPVGAVVLDGAGAGMGSARRDMAWITLMVLACSLVWWVL